LDNIDDISDRAIDLFSEWEVRCRSGDYIELEKFCETSPELLAEVRKIADHLMTPAQVIIPTETQGRTTPVFMEGSTIIGHGGSSIVYKSYDAEFGMDLAYKILQPNPIALSTRGMNNLMARFRLEAKILARLKHDGIVRIYRIFLHHDKPVLAMEYLPGGDLGTYQTELRAKGEEAVVRFFHKVTVAVAFAHSKTIVHRDLKPGNILISAQGEPCVSDFGIAKMLMSDILEALQIQSDRSSKTVGPRATNRQPGTRLYMAPEQYDTTIGPISPATDVYSLGLIFHQLLTGELPERQSDHRSRYKKTLPRRWRKIVRKSLEVQPKHRYQSAEEMAKAIAKKLEAMSINWMVVIGIIIILGLILILTFWKLNAGN
jgi:eukaryotic-like serine/threonine-protein kinase